MSSAIVARQDALDGLYARLFPAPAPPCPSRAASAQPEVFGDADLVALASRAKNGAKFERLYQGDTTGYGSHSEADAALCSLLAFYTDDPAQIDRLFRDSGLYREKWEREDYRTGTIALARERTERYTYPGRTVPPTFTIQAQPREPDAGAALPSTFTLTDYGNAQRLAAAHGTDLRYCHPFGRWYVYDGTRWVADETAEIMRRAKQTVRAIYAEAGEAGTAEAARALAKHAGASERAERLRALVELAKSEPGIPIATGQLDADPWLLNVANGTLDLRTGTLREHRREDYLTRRLAVAYDPAATVPAWDAFLDRIMGGSPEMVAFLRRAVGYALTGSTRERALFILHGTGRNGKSTLLETLLALLGEYALRTPVETLLAKRDGAIPNDVARLKGARFVAAAETEEGRRLAEATVKELTGGDTVSARFMRGEWFDFRPECKLWLATNHKPTIRGTDRAIWDRIRLIPFAVRIPDAEQDQTLPERLRAELPGILAWAVAGCLAWQREGLSAPEAVTRATEDYRAEQDVLAAWLADCCAQTPAATATAAALYTSYARWCEESGERALPRRTFGQRLAERGFTQGRTPRARVWQGIGLAATSERAG